MKQQVITRIFPLGFPWETMDPFLFCVHHEDFYPAGNGNFGPRGSLNGRNIGQDFVIKDGWRMYHGEKIPGFPVHPHRGFETVTVVRRGIIDHADSLGAAGRYGAGDVQWMTAGRGVQHAEMFPLLNENKENTLELFQIWLNLPQINKMVEPHFTMLWREAMSNFVTQDADGRRIEIEVTAGAIGNVQPLATPPDSWAADADNHVAIWTIKLDRGAKWKLPAAVRGLNRVLYFFRGSSLKIAGENIAVKNGVQLLSDIDVLLENSGDACELLLLQGRPINEPVVQYGPFVMNTRAEIEKAFADYKDTEFGGWPWPSRDPVHGPTRGRFAKHIGGRVEEPGGW